MSTVATDFGTEKYVHAAFFSSGVLAAFLIGKVLEAVWNTLAAWSFATHAAPLLLRLTEDERPRLTMVVGAVIAIWAVLSAYRNQSIRSWAEGVAVELAKVHWPDRETVTNGTIVVIAASLFATVYIGVLDRFWGFLTMLVYGA